MIAVAPQDAAQAMAAIGSVAEGPIFLQANLADHGIGGDHPRALSLWRNADWTAFLGLSNTGVLFPQMRDATPADWAATRPALAGRAVSGVIGAAGQVEQLRQVLGLTDAPVLLDRVEPGFSLRLERLRMPDTAGFALRPPDPSDLPLLTGWRVAYRVEILGDPAPQPDLAASEVADWLRADSHRILLEGDRPVSLAGLNARIPGTVQVGGVYTPPGLRGRGLARRAVAMLLDRMRDAGQARAFLFAASDAAAAAYRAIGFRPEGHVRLVIHDGPVGVAP